MSTDGSVKVNNATQKDNREFTFLQIVNFAKHLDITMDKAVQWIFDSDIKPSDLEAFEKRKQER